MAFAITGFNIGITVFGGWATIFGLFSNILKDRYYLSEACEFFFLNWRRRGNSVPTIKQYSRF